MNIEIKPFEFEIRTHVIFGQGKIDVLAELLEKESFKSVCIIIDWYAKLEF